MIGRIAYYVWIVAFFPVCYFALPGLGLSLDRPGMFATVFVANALLLGWLGDAVIFGRGTAFGQKVESAALKWGFLALVILLPVIVMSSDFFAS